MATQKSNSPVIFLAVLIGAVVVVVAILNTQGKSPRQAPAGTEPEINAPAEPEENDEPEGTPGVTELDLSSRPDPIPAEPEGDASEPVEAGASSLAAAAGSGDLEALTRAIGEGGDIDARDESGRTALMFAAGEGHVEAVLALLNAGADPALRDAERRAARDHALARFDERGRAIVGILEDAVGVIPVTDPSDK